MNRNWFITTALAAAVGLPAVAQQQSTPTEPEQQQDQMQQPATPADRAPAAQPQQPPGDRSDAQRQQTDGQQQPSAFMLVVPVPVTPAPEARLAPDADDIRDLLASATEAAVAKGSFDDLVERLVDADRNRLGEEDLDDREGVDLAVERVQQAWEAAFGDDDVDIEQPELAYANYPVIQGEISEQARLAAVQQFEGNEPEDYNLEAGREVAVVGVPASGDLPELAVPLIDEAFGWKIDIPNRVHAGQLDQLLTAHLNQFAQEVPQFSGDELQAQRHLTHHVLMALMGQGPQDAGQPEAQPQPMPQR